MWVFNKRKFETFTFDVTIGTYATDIPGITLTFSRWAIVRWGDGSSDVLTSTAEKTHTYSSNDTFKVTIEVPLLTTITSFQADNAFIDGTIDFAGLTELSVINIYTNSLLTEIANIESTLTSLLVYDCDITGICDLSSATLAITNAFSFYGNANLTDFSFQNVANTITNNLFLNDCDLTGTLDFSYVEITALFIDIFNNPNLTSVSWKTGTVIQANFSGNDCALDAILNSANITAANSCLINLQDNAMSATEVDNTIIGVEADGTSNGTLQLQGTNAARTAASDAANTALGGRGWTVTTTP